MNILIINCILSTAEKGVITPKRSIWDCMISTFARGFIELGHHVTLLASQEFKPTDNEQLPFEVIYFPSRYPKLFKPDLLPWPRGMRQWLKENAPRFDLVIASETFQISTLLAAGICKPKLLVWQEMVRHQRLLFKLPSKFWYNVIVPLHMRDVTVVPRSEPAAQFMRQYRVQVSDTIVDHGTDATVLYPSEEHDNSFVVIARLVPGKNVDRIITKFARLVSLEPYRDYTLNIIGDGDEMQALSQLTASLGIHNNVVFHGFLSHEQLAEPLRRAMALLVDTSNDLNMLTTVEAITSGTPVVTNTVPSSASFIAANGLGIVRDGWDENDLIEVINNYDQMHQACVREGKQLTNVACARKMIAVANQLNN
jgi:1,2-diacylglycerol 3-alpha-glucosyltransferase